MAQLNTPRDAIIAKLRKTAPALRAEGVTKLAISGSRVRGDARDDSNLDVLTNVDPGGEFFSAELSRRRTHRGKRNRP